jgi:DnaJ-class molecular chaperone
MHNPFLVLGASVTATDAELRARYLDLIRQHPPEAQDGRFEEIAAAYALVKTPSARGEWRATSMEPPADTAEATAAHWMRLSPAPTPPPLADFQAMLRKLAK